MMLLSLPEDILELLVIDSVENYYYVCLIHTKFNSIAKRIIHKYVETIPEFTHTKIGALIFWHGFGMIDMVFPMGNMSWIYRYKNRSFIPLSFTHETLRLNKEMLETMIKWASILVSKDKLPNLKSKIYGRLTIRWYLNYPEIISMEPRKGRKYEYWVKTNDISMANVYYYPKLNKWSVLEYHGEEINELNVNEINGNYQYKLNYLKTVLDRKNVKL